MQLTQFISEADGFAVRALYIDGSEWFVAKDVCDALGVLKTSRAVDRLDPDEVSESHLTDTSGRSQNSKIVSESGLYALILRSNKPKARAFRKWVTSEVLPAIRKTGGYSVGGDPAEIVRLEVESLARKIHAVGVPQGQAEKAARAAFKEKLNAMRLALTGRAAYVRETGQNQGQFAMAYRASDLLDMLSAEVSLTPTALCEKACIRFGMGRSTFYRMVASLRRDGRIASAADGTLRVIAPELQLMAGGAQ